MLICFIFFDFYVAIEHFYRERCQSIFEQLCRLEKTTCCKNHEYVYHRRHYFDHRDYHCNYSRATSYSSSNLNTTVLQYSDRLS